MKNKTIDKIKSVVVGIFVCCVLIFLVVGFFYIIVANVVKSFSYTFEELECFKTKADNYCKQLNTTVERYSDNGDIGLLFICFDREGKKVHYRYTDQEILECLPNLTKW